MTYKIDEKDEKILESMSDNAKQTSQQLSKRLNMPITTIHHRIKRMEQEGVIKGYCLKVDHEKLGKPIAAYVLVTVNSSLPSGTKTDQQKIARLLKFHNQVEGAAIVTGGTDIMLKLRVGSVSALNKFLLNTLRGIDGVDKTQTMVVLEEI